MAAVGVSVAAHAVAALSLAAYEPFTSMTTYEEAPIVVSLVDAADMTPRTPQPEPAPAKTPEPSPAKPAAPGPAPSTAEVKAPPPEEQTQAARVAFAAPPPDAPRPPTSLPTPRAASAEDPMVDYRRRVWAHLAARAPAAPPGAGVAVVKFGTDETGAILFARISRSSGAPTFDRACLRALRAAAPLPSPPAGVDRDALVFELPIKPNRR